MAESQQPTADGFKRMDADGDGFATPEEADAYFRERWEEMRRIRQQDQGQQQGQPAAQ